AAQAAGAHLEEGGGRERRGLGGARTLATPARAPGLEEAIDDPRAGGGELGEAHAHAAGAVAHPHHLADALEDLGIFEQQGEAQIQLGAYGPRIAGADEAAALGDVADVLGELLEGVELEVDVNPSLARLGDPGPSSALITTPRRHAHP